LIVALTFISGKAYLIQGKDGSVLVDTLSPWNGRRLVRRLERLGIDLRGIRLILLTHGHIDHFGNALRLKAKTGAPIAIHELDAEGPRKGRNLRLYSRNILEKVLGFFASRTWTQAFEPDILLKGDEGDLEQYGVAAKWVRTPGHTDGSVSIVLPGEAAVVGDLVVGRFNALKRPAYPFWVRDEQQVRESIRKLLDYAPSTFYSGHGGPFKTEDVRRVFLER
jgi:glyoxylase-like metal-dependent hydrolase (beta-lactamase superfamily II)